MPVPTAACAALCLAALVAAPARAETGGVGRNSGDNPLPVSRVAIVSFQRVFEKYERTGEVKDHLKALREELGRLRAERNRLEFRLKELMPKRRENLEEILDLYRALAKNDLTRERTREEFRQRMLLAVKEIAKDIIVMVRQLAKEKGFNVVLNYVEPEETYIESAMEKFYIEMNRTFPYTDGRDDLTDEVIARLNAEWERKQARDR